MMDFPVAFRDRSKKSRRQEKTDNKKLNRNACEYCGTLKKHCHLCRGESWIELDQDEEQSREERLAEMRRTHDKICSCNL